jgi:hypothetical protein
VALTQVIKKMMHESPGYGLSLEGSGAGTHWAMPADR